MCLTLSYSGHVNDFVENAADGLVGDNDDEFTVKIFSNTVEDNSCHVLI